MRVLSYLPCSLTIGVLIVTGEGIWDCSLVSKATKSNCISARNVLKSLHCRNSSTYSNYACITLHVQLCLYIHVHVHVQYMQPNYAYTYMYIHVHDMYMYSTCNQTMHTHTCIYMYMTCTCTVHATKLCIHIYTCT